MLERKYRFILCVLALLKIACNVGIKSNNLLQSEDIKIYPIPSPNYEMKRPEFVYDRHLRLMFTFHNEMIVLSLISDEDKRTDIPVYSLDATEINRIDTPCSNAENTIVPQRYTGENGSFSTICEWDSHFTYRCKVSGVLFNRGILWGVVPLQIKKVSQKKNSEWKKNVGSWHRIFKLPSKDIVNWIWPRNLRKRRILFQSRLNRRKIPDKESYTVELAFILHAHVFSEFLKVLPQTFKNEQTAYFIKEYYSEMSRVIDMMFKTMSSQRLGIEIKLTSLIYTYDKNASVLFHDEDINEERFNAWFNQPSNVVAQMCDHAILLTVEEIHGGSEQSMCSNNSTSIIREMFGFQTAMRVVHALAISFGIQEDGKGNNCPSSDRYIMASYHFHSSHGVTTMNRFHFSSCSKKYLEVFLIQNHKSVCLLTESNFTQSYTDYFLLPSGQRVSANQQCRLRFGKKSDIYKCEHENFVHRDGFCAEMACLTEDRCDEMVPLEGTTCGVGKWCVQGYCRTSHRAPKIPMDCWLGDRSAEPLSPDSNLTCKDIAYGYTYKCYDKRIRSLCCWTCFFLHSTLEHCQYGDRATDCWANECMFYNQGRINYDCCSTCQVLSGSYREQRWQIGLFILVAMLLKIHLL